jgi:lipoprotein-releasing system permease protein
LNTAYFIAKKLTTTIKDKSSISRPIIKIAMVAIAIGIIMMVVSVATGIGFQQKIREKVSSFNGHIIISHFDDNVSEVSKTPISTKQDFYPTFSAIDGIKHIQAIASKAGIIRTEKAVEGIIFKGVGTDFDWNNIEEYLIEGRLPNFSKEVSEEILISEYLANRLQLKLDDRCTTYFLKENEGGKYNIRVFVIVGIYKSGFQEFDNTHVLGDIQHVQRINKWDADQIGHFEVFIDDFSQLQSKGEEVYEYTGFSLNSRTIEEKYAFIFEWLKLLDVNIVIILVIMVLVSAINMVVVLLVLILEKTQMIGMLKALGADNWLIRKVFLYHALHIISKGLLWGNVIAIALIVLQQKFEIITLNPENYHVTVAPIVFNPLHILLINLGTVAISLLVLMVPSYLITKISPVKAIKFD